MISTYGVLGALLVFGAIIFFHELGHFIVAKISGMTVFEFSLGFGPALVSKTYHDTLYALRIFPLGGYVRIAGMEPDEDPDVPNGFNSKSFPAKFCTILAGVVMNGVLALLIFIVMGMAIGSPQPGNKTLVAGVELNSPAAKAGVKEEDIILAVNGVANPTTTVPSTSSTPSEIRCTSWSNVKEKRSPLISTKRNSRLTNSKA